MKIDPCHDDLTPRAQLAMNEALELVDEVIVPLRGRRRRSEKIDGVHIFLTSAVDLNRSYENSTATTILLVTDARMLQLA